jgi:hypothetical protein
MKKQDDYLATSLWYREVIKDPYQVIAKFFTCATINSYRKTIKDVLISISKDKLYRKDSPGDLLLEFKMIESVINAAYLMNHEKKKSPIDISPTDVFNKNLYCGRHTYLTEWDYFPRSLSMKEFIDPYSVFKKFFRYQKLEGWKKDMQEILEYALADISFFEGGLTFDVLSIYFHLTKLLEAAHLIDVREVNHVGGRIKNRF